MASANAYLGADLIARALDTDAPVVLTGRVGDPSLFLACAMHRFGWRYDDWPRLAAGTVAGHLRLAAFSTAVRGLVAPALRPLLDAHPELSLTVSEREPWDTVDLVAAGHVDVGLVHSWGDVPLAVPEHLTSTVVAQDVADVLAPAGHRLAGRARVSPRDLLDEAWIATPEGTICRQWLLRMYDGTGRVPDVAHVSMEFASHVALVQAGLGIALVPRLGRGDLPDGVVAVPAHDPVPTRQITVLHRRSMAGSPAVGALVAALGG
jgi:DNA-binding transcriptional LysR family regulator